MHAVIGQRQKVKMSTRRLKNTHNMRLEELFGMQFQDLMRRTEILTLCFR